MSFITNSICTTNKEIDVQSGTGTVNIGTSSSAKTINIGTTSNAIADTINIGNGGTTASPTINIGTSGTSGGANIQIGSFSSSGTGLTYIESGGALNLDSRGAAGQIYIGANTSGVVFIGNTSGSFGVQIYTGSGGLTVAGFTNYGVVGTSSSGLLSDIAAGANGTVLTSNGTSSLPSWQASGGGSSFTWNNVTSATQTMSVANGYLANDGATLVTLTLPTTAAILSIIQVQGAGSGLWKIAQNSGQTISFNSVTTTSGATGSVSSTSQFDSVTLICIVANTTWAINQSSGNLSVV